jgi:hypothetical protein
MAETAEAVATTVKLCSKCRQHPRADEDGTNPWCLECRADYKRAYEAGKAEKMKDLGFVKGAEAMKTALLNGVRAQHPGLMTNYAAVAQWISEFPTPRH